jgi:putative addiction module component (TIGR02574 family)
MRLDPQERAALTGLLIESLEPESEEGVEEAWVAEIERRMAELDSGAVQAISWEELRARLYGSASGSGRR